VSGYQNRKIEKKENMIVLSKSKSLEEHFMDVKSKQKRNSFISLPIQYWLTLSFL